MKRLPVLLFVMAIIVGATSQANASYQLMRWTSGFCQVWDNSTPWKPFPNDYKMAPRKFKTFGGAMAMKNKLIAHRACSW